MRGLPGVYPGQSPASNRSGDISWISPCGVSARGSLCRMRDLCAGVSAARFSMDLPTSKTGAMKRRIFITDAGLVVLFVLTLYSGFVLHRAGGMIGGADLLHAGAALIFVLCTLLHLWDHKAWFRRPVGLLRRRKLTTTLLALSCVVLTVTGVWLLIDQPVGETLLLERWHGVGALLFLITGLIHIVGRLRVLGRGIKRVVSG